tara:strand:+ start:222 stop:593 length:372 start_codon:yes stop_codon:yes gene_type:complete
MGYRSDVAIAIHKDLQGDFLTFLKTEELMAQIFGDMSDFEFDKDYQCEGHWLFTCNSIKWYTTFNEFEDIQMFEKFMDAMEEDVEKREKFRFLRIGEELEDIEYRGDWWESEIHVKREIQVGY